jgi:glutaredoxin 2
MVLGLLDIPFESIVLAYHDEATPNRLTGVKMLPIMEIDKHNINESLDIIAKLDKNNILKLELLAQDSDHKALEDWLTRLGTPVHNLCMPYWVWTPEFDAQSRQYFIKKKSAKRGHFDQLMKKQDEFLVTLKEHLDSLEKEIDPFYGHRKEMTIFDIMIASHLWGMTLHPEFQFSEKLYDYLMRIKKQCQFDYHGDYKSIEYFQ